MKNYLAAMALSAVALASGAANAAVVMYTPWQEAVFPEETTDYTASTQFVKFDPTVWKYALNSVHIALKATATGRPEVACITPGADSMLCKGTLTGQVTATLSTVGEPDLVTTIPVALFDYAQPAGFVVYDEVMAMRENERVYCVVDVAGCTDIDAAIVALFSGVGMIGVDLDADGLAFASQSDGFALTGIDLKASAIARLRYDYIVAPVPVPASLPLLAGGVALLGWAARRRKAA